MARPRGGIPSPKHVLRAAYPHQLRANVPAFFSAIPPQLSMWLNDTDGDCVTAEEAFAKGAWSVMQGLPDLFIPDSEVQAWASAGGFLNGAVLSDVLAAMQKSGFTVNGVNYSDGPPESVNYGNWAALTSALSAGPVKIGVDADDIETAVNTTNGASGWYGTGWSDSSNQDHCVSLCGYGTVAQCYQMLASVFPSVVMPSSANASVNAVLMFTWKSIGVVEHASMVAVTSEAWLRTPTTPQQAGPVPTPVPPTPTPTPAPGPTIPTDIIGYSPSLAGWYNGAGWPTKINSLNETLEIQTVVKQVDVPKGMKLIT